MNTFHAGDGINVNKLNENFEELKNQANSNETNLTNISNTALLKDGSNMSADLVTKLNGVNSIILENVSGDLNLLDTSAYDITLSGPATIVLPTVLPDNFSHTITVVINQNGFSLDVGTTHNIVEPNQDININAPYSILYVFNKIDNLWYAAIGG